jgi:hypothetical protein
MENWVDMWMPLTVITLLLKCALSIVCHAPHLPKDNSRSTSPSFLFPSLYSSLLHLFERWGGSKIAFSNVNEWSYVSNPSNLSPTPPNLFYDRPHVWASLSLHGRLLVIPLWSTMGTWMWGRHTRGIRENLHTPPTSSLSGNSVRPFSLTSDSVSCVPRANLQFALVKRSYRNPTKTFLWKFGTYLFCWILALESYKIV